MSTNFLKTPRGLGHPGEILGTSQVPSFKTQGKINSRGGNELFRPPPPVGARNRYHLSVLAFFPQFYSTFWPSLGAVHVVRPDVFPCFKGISGGFGVSEP